MIYENGLKRHCYLILVNVIIDYEKQVLITEIKDNMQYSACYIFLQEQKNLTKTWPPQTHKSIWVQPEQQGNNFVKQQDKGLRNWLHLQECFAWDYWHVNIYAILLLNILHQLYNGIIINLVGWLTKSIKTNYNQK